MKTEVKFFEVRDAATCIPVMVVMVDPDPGEDRADAIVAHAGFRSQTFFVTHLTSGITHHDQHEWHNGRTMQIVHKHIEENWELLGFLDDYVICVEHILGERRLPKIAEIGKYE